MPSCVVKCCRNNSSNKSNQQTGITFHKFPSKNKEWRKDCIDVVRESRGDGDWLPSKYSVMCSAHFETNDLYITKGGLLRIVKYAVPKKLLFEPHKVREEQPASPNISTGIEEISIVIGEESSNSKQPVKVEQSSALSSSQIVFDHEPENMQEEQSVSPNTSNEIQKISIVMNAEAPSFEQPVIIGQSISPSSTLLLPGNSLEKSPSEDHLERQLSTLKTPMERRLKRTLMIAQTTVQNQKRKIKTLNQKIRRLEYRNRSLKQTLNLYMKNIFKVRKVRVPDNI